MLQEPGWLAEPYRMAQQAPFKEPLLGSTQFFLILMTHKVLLEGLSDFTAIKIVGRRDSCYSKTAPHGCVPESSEQPIAASLQSPL